MRALLICIFLPVATIAVQAGTQTTSTESANNGAPTMCDSTSIEFYSIRDDGDEAQESVEQAEAGNLQMQVKGFLDTYHAVRSEGKADLMSSRTRARGEVKIEKGAASLFLSLNATHNGVLTERTGVELREAYLSYQKGNLDLRAGRQIIVWGVADALRLTDCVSPCDYTEFLAQDYDDIRMPTCALRGRYSAGIFNFEGLFIPLPDFIVMPTEERNPWAFRPPSGKLPYTMDLLSGRPGKRIKNAEFGGRISANLRGADFSLAAFHTWNKMPALRTSLHPDKQSIHISGEYRRTTMLGADCSLPVGHFVLRSEVAFFIGEAQGNVLGGEVARRNTLHALAGVDWYPGSDWTVSIQYSHQHTYGNLDYLSAYRNAGLATARLSKDLLRNSLKISSFAYVDVTNGGIFNRLSAAYSLTDQVELSTGYDYFHADKGRFAPYARNSEVWMKVKYSF